LSHHVPDAFAGQTRPRVGERVALGGGGGDAREADALVVDRSREGRDGARIGRPGEHEVVGRRLEGRGHDGTGTFDRPEPVLGVDGRMADQRAGEAEDQVVAGSSASRSGRRRRATTPRRRNAGPPSRDATRSRAGPRLTWAGRSRRLARFGRIGTTEGDGDIAEIEVGATITAPWRASRTTGAFLQLEDGRMGLVHISEIDRNYVKDVREHLREGDAVEAKVVAIKDDGKIDLSIKALQDPPPPRAPRRGSDPEFEQMMKKFLKPERGTTGRLPPRDRAQAQVGRRGADPPCGRPPIR
jgi:S1 RNA binding domain protein